MLEAIRERSQGWIAKVILILLIMSRSLCGASIPMFPAVVGSQPPQP
jgi:hypothetical protein